MVDKVIIDTLDGIIHVAKQQSKDIALQAVHHGKLRDNLESTKRRLEQSIGAGRELAAMVMKSHDEIVALQNQVTNLLKLRGVREPVSLKKETE